MKKRLTIAHIIPELDINVMGGVGSFLRTLVRCICQEATKNIILTYRSNKADKKYFQDLGVDVFSRLTQSQKEDGNSLEVTRWLVQTLKQIKPDIVQTNAFWGDTLGRWAAFSAGVPLIIAVENNVNLAETAKQKKIKHHLAKVTDAVVCVSEVVRKYSLAVEKIPDERIEVIYNGLILQDYKFSYGGDQSKPLNFICVARLEPQKVPLRLIEAFAQVIAQGYDCCLWMIGDGRLRPQCQARVATLGLCEKVKFLGYQENPWSLVPKGSVFILSSDFEGLSIAILEAMASGSLCILPNNQTEVAKSAEEAIFYELGNLEQLVEAMILVLQMPIEQRIQMIKAARTRVERDFDAYLMANRYLNLYQNLYQKKHQLVIA